MRTAALLPALLALGAGCAPVLSTMTPAPTTPAGHFRGSLGVGVNVATGSIVTILDQVGDAVDRAADERVVLTDDEKERLLEDTARVLLNPPGFAYETQGRVGVWKRADVGFRFASGARRRDGRVLFTEPGSRGIAI